MGENRFMVTVMLLAHNEQENIKKVIQSFRLFCDIDISLIIADNGSTDGLREWMREQTDLTYIYMDEGHVGWAEIINKIKNELQIDTDLLIMDGHYVLTPMYLSRLVEVLYGDENIGAVGGVSNAAHFHQAIPDNIHSYGEAVEWSGKECSANSKKSVILDPNAILWKKDALDSIGEFCEGLESIFAVMGDYCLRAVTVEKELMVCTNAVLWELPTDNPNALLPWEWDLMRERWGIHYLGSYNEKLIQLIEKERNEEIFVLEIGCASGGTLTEIKNRYPHAKVYGTEINEYAAGFAAHSAEVAVNNIEERNLPFHRNVFDYIIFGDVLEHLHEPLEILKYCREFLKKDGCIIASIPNLMHISVIEQLLQGNFTYGEYGLLDSTHIHMFTYNEIIRTFLEAGYEIENIVATGSEIDSEQEKMIDNLLFLGEGTERFMYETYQYNIKAKIRTAKIT